MQPEFLHDKNEIEAFLRRDIYLHLYALGDLDDFFWPYTSWLGWRVEGQIEALILVYSGNVLPAVLALAEPGALVYLQQLFHASLPLLPRRFFSQFSPGLIEPNGVPGYRVEVHGRLLKMRLENPRKLATIDMDGAEQLSVEDTAALRVLYEAAYPHNWFDPRMLETGCYFGVRRDGSIVSTAGIHVYSPGYRAAALGNITTHPAFRGQGLGKAVTARLCQHLYQTVDHIGLNVRADNAAALATYTRLGFVPHAEFDECYLENTCD